MYLKIVFNMVILGLSNVNVSKTMKYLFSLFAKYSFVFLILLIFNVEAHSISEQKISARVVSFLNQSTEKEEVSVWIYFIDKGDQSSRFDCLDNFLPNNAKKRRAKTFKSVKNLATFYDKPVNEDYILALNPFLNCVKSKSKWLNAISANVDPSAIDTISKYLFVRKIEFVSKSKKVGFLTHYESASYMPKSTSNRDYPYNYGESFEQNYQTKVIELHQLGFKGLGVIICIMDAGFNNLSHPALSHIEILGAYDFVNNDNVVFDESDYGNGDHGTYTLSTIAGFSEGNLIGPAFGSSYILAKTENTESETPFEEDNWIAAMEWAEYNFGPDIITSSVGYRIFDDGTGYEIDDLDGNSTAITVAADIAAFLGIVVVNSIGNNGPDLSSLSAPSDADSILTVGSLGTDGCATQFSSLGPTADGRIKPDVAAPGVAIQCASPHNFDYLQLNGTSLSCPLVAGTVALLIEAFPNVSNIEIQTILKLTAKNSYAPNNRTGWGLINGLAAYNLLQGKPHIIHKPYENSADLNGPYRITCQVLSEGALLEGYPYLWYRQNGENFRLLHLNEYSPNMYETYINGTGHEAVYDYFFCAMNSNGFYSVPENAPDEYLSFSTYLTAIPDTCFQSEFIVYPNPFTTSVTVCCGNYDRFEEIKIFSIEGHCLLQIKEPLMQFMIDFSRFQPGVYIIAATFNKRVMSKIICKM